MSNLIQRTLSGAAYVAVVVASILVNPLAFAGVFLIVSTLAVREWHVLLADGRHVRWNAMILNILLFLMSVLLMVATQYNAWSEYAMTGLTVCAALYVMMLIGALVSELVLSDRAQPGKHWGDLLSGQVMVGLPFACMTLLLTLDKWILLAVFVLLWTNDTMAYCTGMLTSKRKSGNHKMAPYISPKKSWEGLIGGALFTIGAAVLLAHFGWLDRIPCNDSVWYMRAIGFGVVAVVGGTLGDLMESLLKRSIGIKDSGKFLPGHGGVLDRFDSLLLAAPLLLIYIVLMSFV